MLKHVGACNIRHDGLTPFCTFCVCAVTNSHSTAITIVYPHVYEIEEQTNRFMLHIKNKPLGH